MGLKGVINRLMSKVLRQSGADLSRGLNCPDESQFLVYSQGKLSDAKRVQLETHFVNCDDCREFLALFAHVYESRSDKPAPSSEPLSERAVMEQTARILTLIKEDEFHAEQIDEDRGPSGFHFSYSQLAAAAVVLCAVGATVYFVTKNPSPDRVAMQAIAMALKDERRIEPRISGEFPWSRYSQTRGPADEDRLHLDRAISRLKFAEDPSAPGNSRLNLARAYLAGGDRQQTARAIEILRELATRGDVTAEVLNETGVGLFQLKRFDEAIDYFTRALNKRADFNEALFNRALANYRAGHYDQSRNDWTQFIATSTDEWKAEGQYYLDLIRSSS